MPTYYEVDTVTNQVIALAEGALTGGDIVDFTADLIEDKNVLPGFSLLFDSSRVSQFLVPYNAIDHLLEIENSFPEKFVGSRRAFLFKKNESPHWALEYQTSALGCASVFYQRDDALLWLRLT